MDRSQESARNGMRNRGVLLFSTLVLLAFSACSPPAPSLRVGMKEFGTNVNAGQRRQPSAQTLTRSPDLGGVVNLTAPPVFIQEPQGPSARRQASPGRTAQGAAPDSRSPTGQAAGHSGPGLIGFPDTEIVTPICPPARSGPLARSASVDVLGAPTPGTYQFRNQGVFSVNNRGGPVPLLSRRTVQNVATLQSPPGVSAGEDSAYTFEVVTEHGRSSTTASYLIIPLSSRLDDEYPSAGAPAGWPAGVPWESTPLGAGIYIYRVVAALPDGSTDELTLTPPLKLMPLPAFTGPPSAPVFASWDSESTDRARSIKIKLHGDILRGRTTGLAERLWACDRVLEGWQAATTGTITSGQSTSLGQPSVDERTGTPQFGLPLPPNIEFKSTYLFGTQYGGISLADDVANSGRAPSGQTIDSRNKAIINSEPD